jgi:hypothetical protein
MEAAAAMAAMTQGRSLSLPLVLCLLTSGSHDTSIFGTSAFRARKVSSTAHRLSPRRRGPTPRPGASSRMSMAGGVGVREG